MILKSLLAKLIILTLTGSILPFAEPVPVPTVVEVEKPVEQVALVKYDGPVRHVFFHSLIIYPEIAANSIDRKGYADYMITVEQFQSVLESLYKSGFVLIDPSSMYSVDENGKMHKKDVFVPEGKRPLIISQDDVSYYSKMNDSGFASKLVYSDGKILAQVKTPEGKIVLSDTGDMVPIVDSFVASHPDFSVGGFKGILALTGFEGVLGYRTQPNSKKRDSEREKAQVVIDALKRDGWKFASHSFWHDSRYLSGKITKDELSDEVKLWRSQVGSLVGDTDLYVGPFGEIFKAGDPRRQILVDGGFKVLYGVGIDGYVNYFDDYLVMNRADIDGYRIKHNPAFLRNEYGIVIGAD